MTEVRFYHLTRRSLEQALPTLLVRCLERGWRALVLAGSADRVAHLDHHLWVFDDQSFLPHGTVGDGDPGGQPILLAEAADQAVAADNPNAARVLFLTDGAEAEPLAGFETVCELFDGRDTAAVEAARQRWRRYRDAGFGLTYWQQSPQGRWEEKHRIATGDAAPS